MKKVTLCAINARFTHSNLALLCLKHAVDQSDHVNLLEMSINDRVPAIVERIVTDKPDAVGLSCYIWNIDHVLKVASTVKKILPRCFILLGGPEVSYDSEGLMEQYGFIDMIIRGPGEISFRHFMERFCEEQSVRTTPSAVIRDGEQLIKTPDAPCFDMDTLPFLYHDLDRYKNKIIYYETSRGCPYRCAYCMSANEKMRFLPLKRVKRELEHFMRANVRQVKLVDRTFNYPLDRAYAILEALIKLSGKYPDARTNFHFEISACLLDDTIIELLSKAPKGLIQLEIGIQTTHAETLDAINRRHDTQKLLSNTKALCAMDHIHVHVDLIAGLPHESYAVFKDSFNDAYALGADKLQLGFLKVLKGSPMREMAKNYQMVYTDYAPYEILSTHMISYDELSRLHDIEHVVDMLYNTGHLKKTLEHLVQHFLSPFCLYEQLALYLQHSGYFDRPQRKQTLFEHLYRFAIKTCGADMDIIREALVYDWLHLERTGKWPSGLEPAPTEEEKSQIRDFYSDKDQVSRYLPEYQHMSAGSIAKRCTLARFEHLFKEHTAVLFDYGNDKEDERYTQIVYPIKNPP